MPTKKESTNEKDTLDAIAEEAAKKLPMLVHRAKQRIQEAINSITESAGEEEKEAVLKLQLAISWNMDKDLVTYKLSFATRYSAEIEGPTPDPNQEEMELESRN